MLVASWMFAFLDVSKFYRGLGHALDRTATEVIRVNFYRGAWAIRIIGHIEPRAYYSYEQQ